MKNSILIIIFAIVGTFVLTGSITYLVTRPEPDKKEEPKIFDPGLMEMKLQDGRAGIAITVIDSCQYIIIAGSGTACAIHKENCNNPHHK